MVVETPSDRDFACFFCGKGKAKSLAVVCPECAQPIDVNGLFQQQKVGDYLLVRYVKRGFYGATYYATNRIRKPFAVKLIPRVLYRYQGKDFDEEIQKYRLLGSHPNIAELIDAGESEVTSGSGPTLVYYIVSEWIEGQSLTEFIKRPELSVPEMYGAILDIASGVARFEKTNLWHNDLNSDNILVKRLSEEERETRRSDSEYICKIVDIGSAVFRQSGVHKIPDDVKFLGLHINRMRTTLLGRPSTLTKEDHYFLSELGKVVAHILDEDPARSVDRVQAALDATKELYSRRLLLEKDVPPELADPFTYLNANDFPTEAYINLLFSDQFPWLKTIVTPDIQPMLITGPRGSGKTILLKSMSLRTRLNKLTSDETLSQIRERVQQERLAGFFVSARIDIGNNCPLTKLPEWAQNEERVNLYFNLLYAYEIINSLHFGMIKKLIDVHPEAERTLCHFICGALNSSFVSSFASLLSPISQIQNQIILGEFSSPVNPTIIGPRFLSTICLLLKGHISCFANKNTVFLLDDFSLPKVPEIVQQTLLPIIWNSGGGYSFRVTAHSESVMSQDLKSIRYLPNREYTEINLGSCYIDKVDLEKRLAQIKACVNDILKRRFALHSPVSYRTMDEILGDNARKERPIAERIREFTVRKKLRALRYAGWQTLIKLCSGDISYVIDMLRRILRESPDQFPVKTNIQHEEIRRYARDELYRLQDYSVSSCNLYEVAAHFGKFSLFKLLRNVGKEQRPGEYLRIEVQVDGLSPQSKQALGDLLRNGVFIDGGFGSSAKGTPTRKLIFKKLFTPAFPTTYNSRDTWPMSAQHFDKFIKNPQQYLKERMSEEGIPPEKQQLEIDHLLKPD